MVEIPTLPNSVDNAVQNLTDKPTASIGQTLSDLWQLALGGHVALAAEKQRLRHAQHLEEYRKSLTQKVDAIPEDKQVEPSIQIAAQALVDSQYCIGSEELREMFANLIARSMHADYTDVIHPSFSKIAQQLSPLDAQMLVLFSNQQLNSGMAIVDFIGRSPNGGMSPILGNIPEIMPSGCSPQNAARSIISLQRLGLIEMPINVFINTPGRYDIFYEMPIYKEVSEVASNWECNLEIKQRVGKLTLLG